MILFKSCPRCGGDVDATFQDDVFCIQCSYRPDVVFSGPHIVEDPQAPTSSGFGLEALGKVTAEQSAEDDAVPAQRPPTTIWPCPYCSGTEPAPLDKLRDEDNFCYRCGVCGHIYSPPQLKQSG